MTEIKIVREDEKATAILKAIRQIDDGEELEPVQHGRWIERKSLHADGGISAQCSICRRDIQYLGNPLKYCPNCGAKIDKGE